MRAPKVSKVVLDAVVNLSPSWKCIFLIIQLVTFVVFGFSYFTTYFYEVKLIFRDSKRVAYLMRVCSFVSVVPDMCRARYLGGGIPDSQSREPGFESALLPIRSLGIFVLSTTPLFIQLYK